jgi:hypothetical protein
LEIPTLVYLPSIIEDDDIEDDDIEDDDIEDDGIEDDDIEDDNNNELLTTFQSTPIQRKIIETYQNMQPITKYNKNVVISSSRNKSFLQNNNFEIINVDVRGESGIKKQTKTIGGALDRFLEDVTEITSPFIEKYSPIINNLYELSKNNKYQKYTNPLEKRGDISKEWMNLEDLMNFQTKNKNHYTNYPQVEMNMFPILAETLLKTFGTLESGDQDRQVRGKTVKTITPFGEMHTMIISGKYSTE